MSCGIHVRRGHRGPCPFCARVLAEIRAAAPSRLQGGNGRRLRPAVIARIVELAKRGEQYHAIAAATGVSWATVAELAKGLRCG